MSSRGRKVAALHTVGDEGDRPESVTLLLEGFACRTKVLPSGERQITALLLPGDLCNLHVALFGEMDHSILTMTPCTLAQIPRRTVEDWMRGSRAIVRALWWATAMDEAILQAWLVNMGRRPADQRTAHLFCELLLRLRAVGLTKGDGYELPFTQQQLRDMLGLSIVHFNRVLQKLRRSGLIDWRQGWMNIPDFARLSTFASFNPNYLHPEGDRALSAAVQ